MEDKGFHFETEVIHAGYQSEEHQGSLVPPLYQTSTFTFASAEQGERRFAGIEEGFVYSRLGNPTVKVLGGSNGYIRKRGSGFSFLIGNGCSFCCISSFNENGRSYSLLERSIWLYLWSIADY